ncbi:DUF2238 domain-containing protein [Photobacterium jeanii]|nr:DUF2238 domain-containing protein [Photobacterium jeanii]PST91276.1 DUF2238 domain-containing protein [Photobacterium jeanii]
MLPHYLALTFLTLFSALAVAPVFREVWLAEIIPVVLIFAGLVITYPRFRFSNTAYVLMFLWLVCHTIGAHYTFANVPFDWVSQLLGTERNMFDRLAHFTIGLYAFPIAEWLVRRGECPPKLASFFALSTIMAVAAGYEIFEWWYAMIAGGDAGIEFLGSQGDIWDAQKDMLADTLGAITALVLFFTLKPYGEPE